MVVPQDIGIWSCSAQIELCGLVVHRRRSYVLAHRPGDTRTTAADVIVGRQFAVARPTFAALKPIESAAAVAAIHRDFDGSGGGTTAFVPLFDCGVVGS